MRWYDRRSRSTVIQTLDASGNQVGDADYSGNKKSADYAHAAIVAENGGMMNLGQGRIIFKATRDE